MTARISPPSCAAAIGVLLMTACGGDDLTTGLNEPVQVHDSSLKEEAQFKRGALPGLPAPPATEENAKLVNPTVTLSSTGFVAYAGEPQKGFAGHVSTTAVALAVRLANAGSGYWLLPVSAPDPTAGEQLQWQIAIDFSETAPVGKQNLLFAAIDAQGNAGTELDLPICIIPAVPDNLNACTPTIKPPETVVSLSWNEPVDLDLRVITPSGTIVDPKNPTAPGGGAIDVDADANCVFSGRNRENLVFQNKPPAGHYLVYANLFDSCKEPSVSFDLSIDVPAPGAEPKTYEVVETYHASGTLLQVNENGGAALGTFVTEFIVE